MLNSLNLSKSRIQVLVPHKTVRRVLHASHFASAELSDGAQESKSVKRRTRKKVVELPTQWTLPDGSVAQPLAQWGEPPKKAKAALPIEDGQKPTRRKRTKSAEPENGSLKETPQRRSGKRASLPKVEPNSDQGTPARGLLANEVRDNLTKFPHCLLLTRVGNFYESYFEQAAEIARLLNIKLTGRPFEGRRIPMCGFPLMHIDKYLKILVQQHNRFVAMCEEFPKQSSFGTKEFERRVTRVITPGTLIDESFINQYENNFLLAISTEGPDLDQATTARETGSNVGLAWIDVSNGEFFSKRSSQQDLSDELARISPREVILDQRIETTPNNPIHSSLKEEGLFVSYASPKPCAPSTGPLHEVKSQPPSSLDLSDSLPLDDVSGEKDTGKSEESSYTQEEASAIALLTAYMHNNLMEHMPDLPLPNREGISSRMQIDSHTIKALEIRERLRDNSVKGSLLSVVKRTVTSSGTRLLSRWLCSPSTSLNEINARQSLVAFFKNRPHLRADLVASLMRLEDTTRIVQRFLMGRGEPDDIVGVGTTVQLWANIRDRLRDERVIETKNDSFSESDWKSLDILLDRFKELSGLSRKIMLAMENSSSCEEDCAENEPSEEVGLTSAPFRVSMRAGVIQKFSMKPESSEELLALHTRLKELMKKQESMQENLQRRLSATSLTLRASPAHGMHVHLSKKKDQAKLQAVPEFIPLAESSSTKTYFWRDWSLLGGQITEATSDLLLAEKEAFEMLRLEVASQASALRWNARILDELDVTIAFAELADEMSFVRPAMEENSQRYDVEKGRHPTVELGLLTSGRVFSPNSVQMGNQTGLQHVISGPNMGGKSTFLRQTALISILAQSGSFVPADRAVLGVVDKIFSRIGAKDDLFQDHSTFMVEMLETADILRRATPFSLVIMDEVGRGTTVKDGLAIAFATIYHLATINKCRALFATHFHELSYMLGYKPSSGGTGIFSSVGFYCTDVNETNDGHFAYSYRMREGVNYDSHGLKVARLAGMPKTSMQIAERTLQRLQADNLESASFHEFSLHPI